MLNIALENLRDCDDHKAVLSKSISVLTEKNDIPAVLLGGSIAVGNPDLFSDIDLYLIVEDKDCEKTFAKRQALASEIGEILFSFIADHNPGGNYDFVVLYKNLIHVDFIYWRKTEVKPEYKWSNMVVLKDANNEFTSLISESQKHSLTPPAPELITTLNQKFWTWVWYTFGKIVRGELWEALADIHLIRSWAILPMFNWHQNKKDEGYRRLEKKLDNQLSDLFKATTPLYTVKSLYYALQDEIKLYTDLRDKVYAQHNLRADRQAETIVITEIADNWQKFQEKALLLK